MYIMAVDLSSRVAGIAEGDIRDERPKLSHERFFSEGISREDAFGKIAAWACLRCSQLPPDRIVMEAPIEGGKKFHQSPSTAYLLLGAAAILTGVARASDIMFRQYPVNTVRSHFIGRGDLKGDDAKPVVFQRCVQLGLKPENYDESDAAALWYFACHEVRRARVGQMDLRLARAL